MKKTSILSIFLVFFVAVIIIGLFGDKIKVYDEEIEVEKIEWLTTEFENNSIYTLKTYTEEEKEQSNLEFDAELKVKISTGLTINFKFICLPANATHTELAFYNEEKQGITRVDLENNETSLVFEDTNMSTTLKAFTTDGLKTTYSIKINLISSSLFPGIL